MTEYAGQARVGLSPFTSTAGWATALAAASATAYWALLGWDTQREIDPVTSTETGPWSVWQVLALAAVVGGLAFAAGRAGRPGLATAVIPAVITVSYVAGAVNDAGGDGLWPIGAALVALGTVAGVLLVAYPTRALSR